MTDKLIIFTRYPEAGVTKTRLIAHLGEFGAAELQRRMTEKVISEAQSNPAYLEVRHTGGSEENVAAWLGKNINIKSQGNGDLGEKLNRAFEESFSEGYRKVIIVGADCPELTSEIIADAYEKLSSHVLTIGPASDGGYYLIGLSRPCPEILMNQPWGTSSLLGKTLAVAENLNLKHTLLPELHDVDLPQDLDRLKHMKALQPALSIIIPTLNEEGIIERLLQDIIAVPDTEIIIADGGSTDKTLEIAAEYNTTVIHSLAGRGKQQNTGADFARGSTLLFLHADTFLPENFSREIIECLEKPEVIAGAFSLNINTRGLGIRLVEKGANFRSRFFQMPYGDQAIFIKKEQFEKIGGFPDIEIMEDFALMRKLRSVGKIETLNTAVNTSGRRWVNKGVLKTSLINQAMIIGYLLGFPPTSLASWYRSSSRAIF